MIAAVWQGLLSLYASIMGCAGESRLLMVLFSCVMAAIFVLNLQTGTLMFARCCSKSMSVAAAAAECQQVIEKPSPIHIVRSLVAQQPLAHPLLWHNYAALPEAVLLENNGSTVLMRVACAPDCRPHLSGAQLLGNYYFKEAAFKWGRRQSEHSIDEHSFTLEMQVLHQADKLAARCEYLTVAYLFTIAEHNTPLNQIVENLAAIATAHSCIELPPFPLASLMQPFKDGYYSYRGSYDNGSSQLATNWLIYSRVYSLSEAQLRRFTRLCSKQGGYITQNGRQLQALGQRCVQFHTYQKATKKRPK